MVAARKFAVLAFLAALVITLFAGSYGRQRGTYGGLCTRSSSAPAAGLRFYYTGIGGGGHAFGYSLHPTDPDLILVGTDVSGAFVSQDGGRSYRPIRRNLNTGEFDGPDYYVAQSVGVANDYFSGFIMATHHGIYSWQPGQNEADLMTHPADGFYSGRLEWSSTYWNRILPFSAVAWDGDNYLVAGAGRCRPARESVEGWEKDWFPEAWEADSLGYALETSDVYSLWRYYFDDANGAAWRPFTVFDDKGAVRDVDVAITSEGDTLVAAATRDGLYIWDSSNPSTVTDLSGRTLHHDGYTYTWTVGEDAHNFWNVDVTSRGTLYVGVAMADAGAGTTDGKAGVYRFYDVRDGTAYHAWWCGDETAYSFTVSNGSIWDGSLGNHDGVDDAAVAEASHFQELARISVLEGTGTAPDTLLAGDIDGRLGLLYGEVLYLAKQGTTITWSPRVWYDPTGGLGMQIYNDAALSGLDGYLSWAKYGNQWPIDVVGFPDVKPGGRILCSFNDRLLISEDYGETWQNIFCDRLGSTGADTARFAGRGWDELNTPRHGLAVLEDGRAVAASADIGIYISTDSTWQHWEINNPTLRPSVAIHNNLETWTYEVAGLCAMPNYAGAGRTAVAVAFSENVQDSKPGRILILWDHDGDGVLTWFYEVTYPEAKTPQAINRYQFFAPCWNAEDGELAVQFQLYPAVVDEASDKPDSVGVLIWSYNAGVFDLESSDTFEDSDAGNDNAFLGATYPTTGIEIDGVGIVYSPSANRYFLAWANGGRYGAAGGVFYGTGGSWTQIMGSGNDETARDITGIALSPGKTLLYVGNRGGSTIGEGGLYRFRSLGSTEAELEDSLLTQLCNNTIADTILSISNNTMLQSRGVNWDTVHERIKRLTNVVGIFVDPADTTTAWLGLRGDNDYQARWSGIWKATRIISPDSTPAFVKVSQGADFDGFPFSSMIDHYGRRLAGMQHGGLIKFVAAGGGWQ